MAYSVTALKRAKPRYAAVIMMTIFRFFLLLSLLMLFACGQRGPLYLPDESTPVVVPAQLSLPPGAQPVVPARVPPDPLESGFENKDRLDEDDPEDEQDDGL